LGFLTRHHATETKYGHWLTEDETDPKFTTAQASYSFGNAYLHRVEHQGQKDMVDHYMSAFTKLLAEYIFTAGIDNSIPLYIVSKNLAAWCTMWCLEYWLSHYPKGCEAASMTNYKVIVLPRF